SSRVKLYFPAQSSPNTPMACLSEGLVRPSHAMWYTTSSAPYLVSTREFGIMCGALVIDSMPPATTHVAEPAWIRSCPSMIAFMPEPHTLFTVVAPAAAGMPALSAAWRAGAWPRLAGSTQPMMTSETSAGATPESASAALIAGAPSWVAGTPVNWPIMAPIGVRRAPTMTMAGFDMGDSLGTAHYDPRKCGRQIAAQASGA